MPGLEASLAVAGHRVRRHGDDGHVAAVSAARSLRSRIAAVASRPPISGICTSMSIDVEGLFSPLVDTAWRPFGDDDDGVPRCSRSVTHELLIRGVVLRHQHAERPRRHSGRRRSPRPAPRSALVGAAAPNAVTIASSRSECLTGLRQARREAGVARARSSERQTRRRQHDQPGAGESSGRPAIGAREREAVDLGHQRVGQDEPKRLPGTGGFAQRRQSGSSAVDRPGPHPPARRASRRGSGGWSRCRRRPARADPRRFGGCRRRLRAGPARRAEVARRSGTGCPSPGSLSTQIRPPISSTSCAEIARPSPVPP